MRSPLSTRLPFFRATTWLTTTLMLVAPALPAFAQDTERDTTLLADVEPVSIPLVYSLPQACALISARPKQLLSAKFLQMYPIEVLQAAAIKHTGLDPLKTESVLVTIEPPMVGPPNYLVAAKFEDNYRFELHPQLTAHTESAEIADQDYLKSQTPLQPSFITLTNNTLLATPDLTLRKLVSNNPSPEPALLTKKFVSAGSNDLYLAVDVQPLRPLINQLLMQQRIPDQFQFVYALPDLVRLVELRLNLTGNGPTELIVEANNEFDATKVLTILEQATQVWVDQALAEAKRLRASEDPIEEAMGRYLERISGQARTEIMPQQEGAKLILFRSESSSGSNSALTMVATSGVLVALLLPAMQAAREAARRAQSMNNLKNIMLALLNYESANGRFPAYANFDEDGKPLLSWRVHILPYLDQVALYDQFRFDEPWDSPHNKQLISKMPEVYLDPSSQHSTTRGLTNYLGIKGENMAFGNGPKGTQIRRFTDGLSNTLMVLQVNDQRATTWTKPDDWELNEQDPLAGLSKNLHPGIFLAAFCDGSVKAISEQVNVDTFKHLLTNNDGEVINNLD